MSLSRSAPYVDQTIRLLKDNLRPGTLLRKRYVVVNKLATTALNLVYRAYDLKHDQWVVVKKPVTDPSASGLSSAEANHCFATEVNLLRRLRHTQLPQLYAACHNAFDRWMILDYIQGQTLANLLQHTHLTLKQRLDLFDQLCNIVSYLHHQNPPVLHTDIKLANILVTAEGRIVLIDLGTACPPGQRAWTQKALGTPGYAPPEQIQNTNLDERSDVYALGKVSAELLGPLASEPIVRMGLDRATAWQPDARFSSVEQFRRAMRYAIALSRLRHGPMAPSTQLLPHLGWLVCVSMIVISLLFCTLLIVPGSAPPEVTKTRHPLLGQTVTPTLGVSASFASPVPVSTPVPLPVKASIVAHTGGIGLNLRAEPTTGSPVLEALPDGTRLEHTGAADIEGPDYIWRSVRTPRGNEGWVAAQYLQPTP